MEHLEVVIFDEIDDYKEKIKGLTFRQWIFIVIMALVVVPTYLLLPKYTPINKDIASYIVIFEAIPIGFLGFIKIHNLNAEQIIPYWYRHYVLFGKPLKYMTDKEWVDLHDKKSKKKNKNNKVTDKNMSENIVTVKTTNNDEKVINNDNKETQQLLTKKQLKEQRKQEKMLKKAKRKYGYFDDNTDKQNDKKETSKTHKEQVTPITNPVEEVIEEPKTDIVNEVQNTDGSDELLKSLTAEQKKALIKKLLDSD